MIGTIRKHQTWLWAFIITVTIISFVVFFSPNANMDIFGGGGGYDFGSINGKPITQEEFAEARAEVILFFFSRYRQWPTEEIAKMAGFDIERETYSRLLIREKLKDMKVSISEEATAQLIADVFAGEDGKFSMERYQNFIREIQTRGFTAEDFERLIRYEVGQQHLVALHGLSGKLVTPQEAEFLFKRDNETLTVDAIFFSETNYLSKVTVNETNVQHFFEQNMAQYRIPDKVQASYVKFDASAFYAKADEEMAKRTNVNQIIESIYNQRGGTNFYKDEKGRGLSFEQAVPKIKEQIRMELGVSEARKIAADFITEVYNSTESLPSHAEKLTGFEKAAQAKDLKVLESLPMDQSMTSKELQDAKIPTQFRAAAFRLTEEEPFTASPVETEDAVYVLALKKFIPGRNSKFSEVKDKVIQDYKAAEARKLARRAGQEFSEALTKGLADGRSLASICGEHNAKPVPLPPFSLSTRSLPELKDRLELTRLQNAVSRLGESKNTDLMATEDGGVVLFLRQRAPVSQDRLQRELPEYARNMAEQRQYAAYGQWMQQLPESLRLVVPAPAQAK